MGKGEERAAWGSSDTTAGEGAVGTTSSDTTWTRHDTEYIPPLLPRPAPHGGVPLPEQLGPGGETTVSHRLGTCDPYRLRPPLPPPACTREGALRRLHYISWTNSSSKNFF